jgi:hypothetical protein
VGEEELRPPHEKIAPSMHILGRLEVLQRMARMHASGMLGVVQARDSATYPFQRSEMGT